MGLWRGLNVVTLKPYIEVLIPARTPEGDCTGRQALNEEVMEMKPVTLAQIRWTVAPTMWRKCEHTKQKTLADIVQK